MSCSNHFTNANLSISTIYKVDILLSPLHENTAQKEEVAQGYTACNGEP